MDNNKQPWEKCTDSGTTTGDSSILNYSMPVSIGVVGSNETISNTEKHQYGCGKPFRTTILGNIIHD